MFVAFSIISLILDFELLVASWAIGDQLVGRRTSPYAGYDRTWSGIVLHFVRECFGLVFGFGFQHAADSARGKVTTQKEILLPSRIEVDVL